VSPGAASAAARNGGTVPDGQPRARSAARPPETCRSCGRLRPVKVRDPAGQPQCSACRRRDPATWRTCSGCARDRPVNARAADGSPLCVSCYRPPAATCTGCGRSAAVAVRNSGRPLCAGCAPLPRRRCGQCGRTRRVAVTGRDGRPDLCPTCRPAPVLTCGRCGQVGPCRTTTADRSPVCLRCQLHDRLEQVLGPDPAPALGVLTAALRSVASLRTGLGWLARSPAVPLLAALARGEQPLSHATLDTAAASRGGRAFAVEHLRRLLVASGALPDRDEHLHRLEQRLPALLAAAHPADQQVLRAYATWQLLRRLRGTAAQARPTLRAASRARDALTEAARFLTELRGRGRDLTGCTQADLDDWLAARAAARRLLPAFLRWAAGQQHLPRTLAVPASPARPVERFQPADQRWQLARRLLHDSTVPDADRVAGLLVLLYGQPLSRTSRLTRQHVRPASGEDGGTVVQLRLGRDLLTLPDPLAALVQRLPAAPPAGVGEPLARRDDWLFPGRDPGRPAHPDTLARRLQRLGLQPRAARNTALLQLGQQLPAVVLADLLGLHLNTAQRWTTTAGGPWAQYVALRV
jgi:hypothetical protein